MPQTLASDQYDFLDDPRERQWLIGLQPQAIAANAYRMYDWMTEQEIDPDSFLRELAFTKAADALGVDYDALYTSWLDEVPLVPQTL